MNATPRWLVVTRAPAFWLCGVCLAVLLPARAQLLDAPTDSPEEPGLELDIQALLSDDRVFEERIDNEVWSVEAQPGRRLIQVPMIVTPKDHETRLATPSIRLRGGRFIAWRIVLEQDQAGGGIISSQTGQAYRDDPYSIGNLRSYGEEDLGRLDPTATTAAPSISNESLGQGAALPEGAPMLARDLTVSAQGVIRWPLERAIPGAQVKTGDTLYLLKLRPDRLQEKEPQRPERGGRNTGGGRGSGQDARQAAEQRRTAELEYREKAQAYRELREQVRDLPDEFQAAMPARLWAVYEVSDRVDELSFTGEPPMPWRIKEADLVALKQVASRSGSGGAAPTAEDFAAVSQMTLMLGDEHALTSRVVADTLSASGTIGQAKQGDAIYRLIDKLLKCGDPQAVHSTTAALASTVPPTPATLALLRGSFEQLDAGSKLLALGGLLNTQDNDPLGRRQMLDTANRMISDPDGPGAVYVLEQLTVALADKPDAVTLVGQGIRFDSLKDEALDQAIVFIASAAGQSPLAAEWMDHGLLSSANPSVSRRTVELLSEDTTGDGIVSMFTRAVLELAFGPGKPDMAQQAKPRLRGIASIPIRATSHGIYRVLSAGDPQLRALGWKAIKHFQITNESDRRGQPAGIDGTTDEPDRLGLILDAAFKEMVTPLQLVTFLTNQQDTGPATAALVRIVVEGRGPAITQAARSLVRSGRQLEEPLRALSPDQRGTFAVRLYEAVTGSSPMVAGLMRVGDSRSPLINWFAQHVATTGLPQPREWAPAANGEDNLLNLAASSDPELADAAVASLVASVGGDEQDARDLARKMSNATDRSVIGLRDQWSAAKQDIYGQKLQSAAGRYRLIVNLRGAQNNPGGYPSVYGDSTFPSQGGQNADSIANAPLIKSTDVALIELRADGRSLSLASGTLTLAASDTQLAIAIENPNELKDFGNADLADLPLSDTVGPIELLEQPGGVWRGGAHLNDGRSIEVVFDPQ